LARDNSHHLTICTICPHTGAPCRPGLDLVRCLTSALALTEGLLNQDFALWGTAAGTGCARSCTLGWHATGGVVRMLGDVPPDCDAAMLAMLRRDGALSGFAGPVVQAEAGYLS
jgi:predicted metal-binding protein